MGVNIKLENPLMKATTKYQQISFKHNNFLGLDSFKQKSKSEIKQGKILWHRVAR